MMHNPERTSGFGRAPLVLALVALVVLVAAIAARLLDRGADGPRTSVLVQRLVASEDLILKLSPVLTRLSESALNLRLPDYGGRALFGEEVTVVDVGPRTGDGVRLDSIGASVENYRPAAEVVTSGGDIDLWRELLGEARYFEHAKFYFVRGELRDEARDRFDTHMGFSGLARDDDQSWRALHVEQDVTWRKLKDAPADSPGWEIERWVTTHADVMRADRRLFRDVLREVVPDGRTRLLARQAPHEKKLVQLYRDGKTVLRKKSYMTHFTPDAIGQHPGLSIVDIDDDGHDDIYVMDRWGKSMLLRARGDGTFEDAAEQFGLDVHGLSTAAAFADTDNDGDVDLMLARSLERSAYLMNDGGRFVDRSDQVSTPLPLLAASVSAADYNADGLIDVYFSTYGLPGRELADVEMAKEFLPADEAEELFRRGGASQADNPFVNMAGPRNVLLVNEGGGRFARSAEDEDLDHWFNTFQATWSDFDGDGDPDLYLANDYAPDRLYRNEDGTGFVDVSRQYGGDAMLGFGMGASFGDYDNDGRQDLYVSNMFSKAGTRITSYIPDIDPRLTAAAAGNLLFRNVGDTFELVSGKKPPKLAVAKAGWSWGGLFGDLDSDGFLDLYVSSGYYTAPPEIASNVDL